MNFIEKYKDFTKKYIENSLYSHKAELLQFCSSMCEEKDLPESTETIIIVFYFPCSLVLKLV